MLDLVRLRYATAVADNGTFSQAARELNVTQSAVTKSILVLETTLGLRLFERTSKGVRTTREGATFLEKARLILRESDALERRSADLKNGRAGELSIGVSPASLDILLASALPQFVVEYPAVRVHITTDALPVARRRLASGEIDLLLGDLADLRSDGDFRLATVAEETVTFFARHGHPLLGARRSIEDVVAYPIAAPAAFWVRRDGPDAILVQPQIVLDSFFVTQHVVERSNATAVVFERHAFSEAFRRRFVPVELADPLPRLHIDVACRAGWHEGTLAAHLLSLIRQRQGGGSQPIKR